MFHLAGQQPEPAKGRSRPQQPPSAYPTDRSYCAEITDYVVREYLDARTGKVGREVVKFDQAIDYLLERHGDLPTNQFPSRYLRKVREAMAGSGCLCRHVVNARTRRIKARIVQASPR